MMESNNEVDERYKNGKIYKIVCNITGDVYIGSTKKYLSERMCKHRDMDTIWECVSIKIIRRGDYTASIIEDYPCNNKQELLWRERHYMETMECINTTRPIITEEEHKQLKHDSWVRNREKNAPKHLARERLPENRVKQKAYRDGRKEESAAYSKQYRANNAESIAAGKKKWATENAVAIAAQGKVYRKENAEEIKLIKAAQYQNLKAIGFITTPCGCGGVYNNRGGNKNRHEKTNKHRKWIEDSLA